MESASTPGKRNDRLLLACSSLVGILLLAGWGYLHRDRALQGHNDFMQLYAGASLIGSGGLYSIPANQKLLVEKTGLALEGVNYTRLPFYAVLLRPLAWLPYRSAYSVFSILSLGLFAGFIAMHRRDARELPLFASLSIPALATFINGQDVAVVLFLAGLAVYLMRREWKLVAGLVFALCAIKFHLFILLPVALAARREWRVLAGGALGATLLAAVSFIAAGPSWPLEYLALLSDPVTHPAAGNSITLRTLFFSMGWNQPALLLAASVAVALLTAFLAARSCSTELAIALSLAGSLLVSYHAYAQDALLLLLVFAIVVRGSSDVPLRAVSALILTPPLYLCALLGPPVAAVLPLCELGLLALFIRLPGFRRPSG